MKYIWEGKVAAAMTYCYRIRSVNSEERWIFLSSNDVFELEEPDSFICLLKKIREDVQGTIQNAGDMCYCVEGDGFGLVYQWDSCFGITVRYPEDVTEADVILFLSKYR